MATDTLFEIFAIFLLVVANGMFALSEIAIVSSRKVRLQQRAEGGHRGAQVAVQLADDPEDFLSAVQIGITLIGTLAGAFGGSRLAEKLAPTLNEIPWIAPNGGTVALAMVVILISYFSLILGELVPKRLALTNPERFAEWMAPPMAGLARITAPAVRLLGFSSRIVMAVLPFRESKEPAITEEEVRYMVKQGAEAGTFEKEEHGMVEGVFRLGDRKAVELMQPRQKVLWIDLAAPLEITKKILENGAYSRYPVGNSTLDKLLGYVHVRDLLEDGLQGKPLNIEGRLRKIPIVPRGMRAVRLLEEFRKAGTHIAAVVNEHGGVEGIVTMNDMMEAVLGELTQPAGQAPGQAEDAWAIQREDGSWLVDGLMPVYEFKDLLKLKNLPQEEGGAFATVAGFALSHFGRIPSPGDHFQWDGWRLEVIDMDVNRIDKLLLSTAETEDDELP
jgi:putative hemolysin